MPKQQRKQRTKGKNDTRPGDRFACKSKIKAATLRALRFAGFKTIWS